MSSFPARWKTKDAKEIEAWSRRATFLAFRDIEFPWLVLGANLDLGPALDVWRSRGIPPYIATVYAFCRAANGVPAFRQRLRGEQVVEHEIVHADYTVPSDDDSFAIRLVPYSPSFAPFAAAAALETGAAATTTPGIIGQGENDHWLFMSCLPWIQITHAVQPESRTRAASIPRVLWGRFFEGGGNGKCRFRSRCIMLWWMGFMLLGFLRGLSGLRRRRTTFSRELVAGRRIRFRNRIPQVLIENGVKSVS